ncbi:hypothetical protein N9Y92_01060 [Chlamydiales bacterium]|nr:hypothetical protein [Chlamydiales bacterium]
MISFLLPILTTLSKGGLNVIDRHFLKKQTSNLHLYILQNCITAAIIGLVISCFLDSLKELGDTFFTLEAFFWSCLLQLVSFSFSYNFQKQSLQKVIFISKIGDTLLAPLLISLFFFLFPTYFQFDFKISAYLIALASVLPLLISRSSLAFIFNKASLLLVGTVLIQCIATSLSKSSPQNLISYWNLTLSIILWRIPFSLGTYLFSIKKREPIKIGTLFKKGSLFRAILMITSYGTFILTINYTNPLITLPIINSSPLVASLMARLFLKEPLKKREITALSGLCISAMI